MRKKVTKKPQEDKEPYYCPHCNGEIKPATMLWERGRAKRDVSPEAMKKLVERRWNRIKLYGM